MRCSLEATRAGSRSASERISGEVRMRDETGMVALATPPPPELREAVALAAAAECGDMLALWSDASARLNSLVSLEEEEGDWIVFRVGLVSDAK